MSSEPEYQRTDDTFADFRRRHGSPSVVENYYPIILYGWWVGSDYVSLRVNGPEHETYIWIDCPEPVD